MKLSPLFVSGLLLLGCSSSSSSSNGNDGGGVSEESEGGSAGDGGSSALDGPAASGEAGTSTTMESGAPTGHQAKIILQIPADYTGTLAKLDLVYNTTAQLLGPPTGTLFQGTPGTIVAGQPLTVLGDATGVDGSYYVVAVLYMKGGGTFVPMPGVDYVGETPSPVAFQGGPIDLGTLPIIVAPADGGL